MSDAACWPSSMRGGSGAVWPQALGTRSIPDPKEMGRLALDVWGSSLTLADCIVAPPLVLQHIILMAIFLVLQALSCCHMSAHVVD